MIIAKLSFWKRHIFHWGIHTLIVQPTPAHSGLSVNEEGAVVPVWSTSGPRPMICLEFSTVSHAKLISVAPIGAARVEVRTCHMCT